MIEIEAELERLRSDYRRNGFAVLREVFVGPELASLQSETALVIDRGRQMLDEDDYVTGQMPDGVERFFRVEWMTDEAKGESDNVLLATTHPHLRAVAETILGLRWACLSSMMVFKDAGGGPEVALHRDDLPNRKAFSPGHIVLTADVYLDDADGVSGCLQAIPGSHVMDDVRPAIHQGFSNPALVSIPMNAGDVLFHDGGLVHGSPATGSGAPRRRVLYFIYQNIDWVEMEGYVGGIKPPRTWIAEMIRLTQEASRRRKRRYADIDEIDIPHDWMQEVMRVPLRTRPDMSWITEAELNRVRSEFESMNQRPSEHGD